MRCVNEKFLCFAHLSFPAIKGCRWPWKLGSWARALPTTQKILAAFRSGLVRVVETCFAVTAEGEAPIGALPKGCVYRIHKIGLETLAVVAL